MLTGIAMSVLMYLTANLAILLYTNNNDINARSINTAKADSRQVDTMTKSIERKVRDIIRILGEPDGNEKKTDCPSVRQAEQSSWSIFNQLFIRRRLIRSLSENEDLHGLRPS